MKMNKILSIAVLSSCIGLGQTELSDSPESLPDCQTINDLVNKSLPVDIDLFYVKPGISYMNTATLGPMPRAALKCAVDVWESFETDPVNMYPWGDGMELDEVRERAASMFSCEVDELVLTPSTTVSLNMVGEGLVSARALEKGANILTTDQEHGGGLAVWQHWQNAGVIDAIDTVPVPYGLGATVESIITAFQSSFESAANEGKMYTVVMVSHVLTTTGLRLPLSELAKLVHDHNPAALFVVDGAQAPGGINVNLTDTGADIYTVSAHKWLLAPTGSGLLYVRSSRAQQLVTPTYTDGGFQAYSQSSGTVPLQTIAGLGYVLDFFAAYGGLPAAENYNMQLREYCYHQLIALVDRLLIENGLYAGLEVISPPGSSGVASPIVAVNLPPAVLSNADAVSLLKTEYGVVVKLLPDHEGGNPFVVNAIRMSHHIFNSVADVDKLLRGLTDLLTR